MGDRPSVPGSCPVCGGRMEVQRLRCPQCGTALEGAFSLCSFCSLTEEQRRFAELFVVARGNLREMERMLGMSYPAVRARLEAVIEALGHGPAREPAEATPRESRPAAVAGVVTAWSSSRESQAPPPAERRAILEALERGELTPEEAVRRLRSRGGSGTG